MSNRILPRKKALFTLAVILAIGVAISIWMDFDGTEFSGGKVTGPLLHIFEVGIISLIVGLIVTPFKVRVAAIVTLLACLLCLPFYLYFIAPGPFRGIFPGEYSVPLQGNFVWDSWMILGLFTTVLSAVLAGRYLDPGTVRTSA